MSQSSTAKKANVEAQQLDGFYVAGLSIMTSNADDRAAEDINSLWQRFFDEGMLHKIEGRTENVMYAVYSDYEGDHTKPFRVTLGCKIDGTGTDLPAGQHKVHVPTGDYAIFSAKGEQPKALLQTWEGIWKMEMPRTYKADIEIYGPRFFEDGIHEVLVCIGITV